MMSLKKYLFSCRHRLFLIVKGPAPQANNRCKGIYKYCIYKENACKSLFFFIIFPVFFAYVNNNDYLCTAFLSTSRLR